MIYHQCEILMINCKMNDQYEILMTNGMINDKIDDKIDNKL
jgi:hypothetical protein